MSSVNSCVFLAEDEEQELMTFFKDMLLFIHQNCVWVEL